MNKQKIIIASSLIVGLIMISSALVFSKQNSSSRSSNTVEKHPVSNRELKAANGKDGKDCLVAVDGKVYLIKDFSLWNNGQHTPSGGLAYCGADLTSVINQSPHGRKILDILIEVGPLIT